MKYAEEIFYKNGGHLEYWVKNIDVIRNFINEMNISATNIYASSAEAGVEHAAPKLASVPGRFIDLGIKGGIRDPHLHFDGKIYLLNEKQWAEFSHKVIADCKAKLAKVNKIDFAEAIVLASVLED